MLNLLNSASANKISNRKSCQPARFEQENGVPVLLSLHCESNPLKDLEKRRVKAMEINNQLEIFISPPCQPLQYFVVKLHTSASRHFPLLHWNCQWLDSPWEPKGTWGIQGCKSMWIHTRNLKGTVKGSIKGSTKGSKKALWKHRALH